MSTRSTLRFLTLTLLASSTLTACNKTPEKPSQPSSNTATSPAPASQNTSSTTQKTNLNLPTYNVAVMGSNPPYVALNEKGNITGLEVDLLKAIGEKQGFNVQFNATPFIGILDTLNSQKADIVGSGIFLTPERVSKYQPTNPYMQVGLGALTLNDRTDINKIEDLQGKKVLGQKGFFLFEEVLKKDVLKGKVENAIPANTTFLAVQSIIQKKGDAAFGVDVSLNDIQKHMDHKVKLKLIQYPHSTPYYVSFWVKKGRNDDLLNKINKGLEQINQDGTYAKIMQNWTGKQGGVPNPNVIATIPAQP
ncbi:MULTISPECIES: substrate-binding periplasmic protein [unclassified Moraxella]|uniref:substrate-binding periplasmic protein n=1 Tax=unclassified Moraxella TaxID=2685852 RepID=UPI003AF6392D